MSHTFKDYRISIRWDPEAEYFIAEIPEILSCAADGPTEVEALDNLKETFAVLKEAYAEEKFDFPAPANPLPISVAQLSEASAVVKVAKVAELAGINAQTLAAKVKRGTELNPSESENIAKALAGHGVSVGLFYIRDGAVHCHPTSGEISSEAFTKWSAFNVSGYSATASVSLGSKGSASMREIKEQPARAKKSPEIGRSKQPGLDSRHRDVHGRTISGREGSATTRYPKTHSGQSSLRK